MSARFQIARGLRSWAITMVVCWAISGMSATVCAQTEKPGGRPVLRETTIEETDLSGGGRRGLETRKGPVTPETAVARPRSGPEDVPAEIPEQAAEVPMPGEGAAGGLPLLAKVTAKTTPQRAASLQLIDEGRESLEKGDYKQALGAFERAIAVDATNPYSHYFVARAHFFLGNYPESFNFLDVAESLLGWHKRWLAEIHVLRGRNAAAMGFLGRADTNYLEALGFDPFNRFAIESLTSITQTAELRARAP